MTATKVVVIDDEATMCELARQVLEGRKHVVSAFGSAEEFVAPSGSFVLVVDKNLPGKSGLDLIAQLQREGNEFEAIIITGYADMDSALRAVRLGVYRYLRKPFEVQELISAVDGAVDRLQHRHQQPPEEQLKGRITELERQVADLSEHLGVMRRMETQLLNERLVSLGQVTASVTHELNNVLTYVIGNFDLLSQRLPALLAAVETLREGGSAESFFAEHGKLVRGTLFAELPVFMKQTSDGLQIIQQLCEDLRGLSRVRDKGAVFDLRKSVETAIRMAGAVVRRNIDFTVDLGTDPQPVRGNSGRLVQAIVNVLINAAESIDSEQERARQIDLKISRTENRVAITIADTGCGIERKYLKDIFKPFVTFKKDGTGLGLPLVKSIVEQQKGEMTLNSEVGEGTTVKMQFPLSGEDWPSRRPAKQG